MKRPRPAFLKDVDLNKLHEWLEENGGDGWTIFGPQEFTPMGFKADDLPFRVHASGEGKYAITKADGTIGDCPGIWNLSFLIKLASELDVKFQSYMGRGFQAREVTRNVKPVIEQMILTEKEAAHGT
jgi:hypothetical protein